MRYSKGICWVDDTRIPFVDEGDIPNDMDKTHLDGRNFYTQVYNGFMYKQNKEGRYTPSLLVCDDMLNDGNVSKSNSGGISHDHDKAAIELVKSLDLYLMDAWALTDNLRSLNYSSYWNNLHFEEHVYRELNLYLIHMIGSILER